MATTRSALARVVFRAITDLDGITKTGDDFLPCESTTCAYTYPVKIIIPHEPYGCNTVCQWVYPMVYGGGLVGGDKIKIECVVGAKCCILWTSLGYPKVYSCTEDLVSYQECQYTVEANGFLCILGDPVQCFKGASYTQSQEFHLDFQANLILLDWNVSGRIGRGERWEFSSYKNMTDVYVGGKLLCREHQQMQNTKLLNMKDIMKSYNATGMCLILGPYLKTFSADVLAKLSKTDAYGERRKPETLFAVSPVHNETDGNLHGCMIKFATESVAEVYKELENIFTPLYSVLGESPFKGKY